MDMKIPAEEAALGGDENGASIYYGLLYGVYSFLVVMVALLVFYVACSKRFRLNWFERNLLESAESQELGASHDGLVVSGERSSRPLLGNEDFWVPVRKPNTDPDDTSDESEEPGSPCTSRGSRNSVAVGGVGGGAEEAVPIARNDKHVVLSTMPAKPIMSMNARLDLSKIDTALYEQPGTEDVEVMSVESKGQVHITLVYDTAAGMLSVRLIEARDLRAKDYSGSADPYAKIRLLPDKSNVWQTRIHKKTLSPVFDEDFVFEVRALGLSRRTLEIVLYDFDPYARHCALGGLKMSLQDLDLTEKTTIWKPIVPVSEVEETGESGELLVSLSFLPSAERLTVVVMKARNLRVVDDARGSSDPFVKVTLNQGTKRLKKKKSSVHRHTVNPVYNERLTFDISKDLLPKCVLDICVYHDAKLGPCEMLGRCLVGNSPSCRPENKSFFAELLTNKSANAKWLVLSDAR